MMPAARERRANVTPDAIVDATLAEAELVGWADLRLFDVAARMNVPLAELRLHFRDLDAVADAWLARGERAMLAVGEEPGFAELPPPERIARSILAFLDALAAHRKVSGQIFRAKLYFGHPHHNLALLFWVSRTVQWWREAAQLRGDDRRRRVEEIGLSALFVATLVFWVADDSEGQERTRRFLDKRLNEADALMRRLFPAKPKSSPPPSRSDRSKPR
jgi:AcrR family transcriptional regulator